MPEGDPYALETDPAVEEPLQLVVKMPGNKKRTFKVFPVSFFNVVILGWWFTIFFHQSTQLREIIDWLAKKLNTSPNKVALVVDGERISGTDTPESLAFEVVSV